MKAGSLINYGARQDVFIAVGMTSCFVSRRHPGPAFGTFFAAQIPVLHLYVVSSLKRSSMF